MLSSTGCKLTVKEVKAMKPTIQPRKGPVSPQKPRLQGTLSLFMKKDQTYNQTLKPV